MIDLFDFLYNYSVSFFEINVMKLCVMLIIGVEKDCFLDLKMDSGMGL